MHQESRMAVTLRHPDPFPQDVLDAIREHAIECFPEESCGLVLTGAEGPYYRACTNVHDNPEQSWRISPEETLACLTAGEIAAVVHSHPGGPNHPSLKDQEEQIASGDTWGIIPVIGTDTPDGVVPVPSDILWWGDALPVPPLERRRFIWGIFHCYQLYRDWFLQTYNIHLPNFACQITFVDDQFSIFTDNCERAGLRNLGKINMGDLQVGDMVVGHLRGTFPNHCAVYLGGDDLLHHPQGGISAKANLLRWWPHIDTVFRYEGFMP